MIVHLENPKDKIKLLVKEFSKIARYKIINMQKLIYRILYIR